jgi:hypothetical protein
VGTSRRRNEAPTGSTRPVSDDVAATCRALREVMLAAHPQAVETHWPRLQTVSFGIGPKKMSHHYAYLAMFKSHVNIGFYHGVSLRAPGIKLEGAGKRLRHVKVATVSAAKAPALRRLIRAAIRERKANGPAA